MAMPSSIMAEPHIMGYRRPSLVCRGDTNGKETSAPKRFAVEI